MPETKLGRPRDAQLHHAILEATRRLVIEHGYAALSMEGVALRAGVGKKTLYRRWPSKAPLVAEAVLDAYGRNGSFPVPDTGDLREDLNPWLTEHAAFIAEPQHAALIRALIAAAAASSADNAALYDQFSAPQHDGLVARLRKAAAEGQLRPDSDLDAVAAAVVGFLLLNVLSQPATGDVSARGIDGLLAALLYGVTGQ